MAYVGIEIIEPPPLPPPSQVVVAVRVDEAETQKEPPSRDGLELLLSPTATDEKVPALLVSNDVVNSSAEEDAAPSAEEEIGGGGARHGRTRWKVCILHFPCFFFGCFNSFSSKVSRGCSDCITTRRPVRPSARLLAGGILLLELYSLFGCGLLNGTD